MNSIHRYAALRKVSLSGLRAFEAAFLHGSFAAAAMDLCVSASAVSHAVGALERALGEPLFTRHKKAIYPTHAGSRLYDVVQKAFSHINAEMQAICAQHQHVKTITVQCAPSLAAIWMMPRLADFLRKLPELDLRVSAVHAPIDFHSANVDIGIVYGTPEQQPDIWMMPLDARECYVPLCSPQLVDGQRLPLPPNALRQFQMMHNETSVISWNHWIDRYVEGACDTTGGLRFDRSSLLLSAAARGLGLCLDSTLLAHEYLRRKQLVMPFGERGIACCAHWLCVPKSKMQQENVQAVTQWVLSWAKRRSASAKTHGIEAVETFVRTLTAKQLAESGANIEHVHIAPSRRDDTHAG